MINIIREDKKLFNEEIVIEPYFPSTIESVDDSKYKFTVSSRYDNTTEESHTGVFLSSIFGNDSETESSFMLSPEDALKLSSALQMAALHSIKMDDIKKDRKLSKQNLSVLINTKILEKSDIKISLKQRSSLFYNTKGMSEQDEVEQTNYVYDVVVDVYMSTKDNPKDKVFYPDASFSFEINLFKTLYAYAMNMIKNNLIESKQIKPKNSNKTVPCIEVFKQFILMEIIKDMYINTSLYKGKELDNLFEFIDIDTIQNRLNFDIKLMIDLVREDLEQIVNPISKDMINIIPLNQNKNNCSTESKFDDNK